MKNKERKTFSFEETDQTAMSSLDDLTDDISTRKRPTSPPAELSKKTQKLRKTRDLPPLPKSYITRSFHIYPETLEKLKRIVYEMKKQGVHYYSQKEALKEAIELLMKSQEAK